MEGHFCFPFVFSTLHGKSMKISRRAEKKCSLIYFAIKFCNQDSVHRHLSIKEEEYNSPNCGVSSLTKKIITNIFSLEKIMLDLALENSSN